MPGALVFSKQKRELAFELNAVVPCILTHGRDATGSPDVIEFAPSSEALCARGARTAQEFQEVDWPLWPVQASAYALDGGRRIGVIAPGHPSALSRSRSHKDADEREFGHASLAPADSSPPFPPGRTCREQDVGDRDPAIGVPRRFLRTQWQAERHPVCQLCGGRAEHCAAGVHVQFQEIAVPTRSR
jgi:hypothetical protein